MTETIKITWACPDILNLHGDRGNLMALQNIGDKMGLNVEIVRHESWQEKLDLADTDMLLFPSGEVKNIAILAAALIPQKEELAAFTNRGGYIFALGSSGALLAQKTIRADSGVFAGLSMLPMQCKERANVYGDDIWYKLTDESGLEILGNQIQILDTTLDAGAQPFGEIIYGHGNNGTGDEGCRVANIIFTNTLGPLFVKNPHYSQKLLEQIALGKNITNYQYLEPADTEYEDQSAVLIKRFIKKKRA